MNSRVGTQWYFVAAALTPCVCAQVQVDWAKTHLSPSPNIHQEEVTSCAVAGNGNVFLTTFAYPMSGNNYPACRVACYSSAGVLLSNVKLNATANNGYPDFKLALDASGSAYSAWTRGVDSTVFEAEVTKTDSAGNILWSQTVDAFPTQSERPQDVVVDAAGNCLVLSRNLTWGTTCAVSKFDTNGQLLWSETAGDGFNFDFALTPSGGVAVIGDALPATVVGLDPTGAQLFATPIDFGNGATARFIDVDPSGAIACAGGGPNAAIALLDPSGAILWTRTSTVVPECFDVRFASDGTLWVAAWSASTMASVVHYDRDGNLLGESSWPSSSQGPALLTLEPGTAGDMRVCGNRKLPSAPWLEAVVHHFDSAGQRIWAWNPVTSKLIHSCVIATGANGRLVVGGRKVHLGLYVARIVQFDESELPRGYCSAETNSLGCTPSVVFTGLSSASAADGFSISARGVLNHRTGLLFYGVNGAANTPFLSGTLCVQPPISRTVPLNTAGNPGPSDCSGVVAFDMNAFASGVLGGSPSPALSVAGTRVWTQAWSRDPGSSSGTNLSSALTYVVLP